MKNNVKNPSPNQQKQKMRILITGGSGFIGTNYIEYLLNIGNTTFINLDHSPPRKTPHKIFWKECDLLDANRLSSIVVDFCPTHVVHLAARTGIDEKKMSSFAANIKGVENLLEAFVKVPSLQHVLFTSTLLVCKVGYIPKHDTDYNANTLYGQSKVEGEKIVRSLKYSSYSWSIIRPISIWGPWCDEPYKNFFKAINSNWYFHIGSGHYKRSLGYVENVTHQIHQLLVAPKINVNKKTFYLADDKPADLYEMANIIKQNMGTGKIWHIPLWLVKIFARIGDICKSFGWYSVPLSSFRLNNIITEYIYDLEPIIKISGPLPFNLNTGIKRTVKWLRETGEISN